MLSIYLRRFVYRDASRLTSAVWRVSASPLRALLVCWMGVERTPLPPPLARKTTMKGSSACVELEYAL